MFVLLGCADDATPEGAVKVNHPPFLCGQMNGDMGEEIVPVADHKISFSAHACMHGMFRK